MAQPWLDFSLALKTDSEANAVLGWVLEMWGYVLAAGSLGIKHTVLPNFQIEPGAYPPPPPTLAPYISQIASAVHTCGMPSGGAASLADARGRRRLSAANLNQLKPDFWKQYYIYHYTYGIEYTMDGKPMMNTIGEWSLDKVSRLRDTALPRFPSH